MSSGKLASVWFSALSISSAVPSKKRPHPGDGFVSQMRIPFFDDYLTASEQGVTREVSPIVAILEQVADAVLGMARRVQRLHLDTLADGESLAMAGSLGDLVAVLAADNRDVVGLQRLGVAPCVIVVTVSSQYGDLAQHPTRAYWWVLMMLVSLIPESVAFLSCGRTLSWMHQHRNRFHIRR